MNESVVDRIGRESGGYAIEVNGAIVVPLVLMDRTGCGEGSRFLDALPLDRTVKFPCVISHRLRAMLERRGFTTYQEWAPEIGEHVEVFVREAVPTEERS